VPSLLGGGQQRVTHCYRLVWRHGSLRAARRLDQDDTGLGADGRSGAPPIVVTN
jgi:hypothetical protein